MRKRVKHPRLPSGYGSIRYLGKRRSKPYAVHPPATERDPRTGEYIRPPVLCYASSWYVGFAILSEYKAGRYVKGMECDIETEYNALECPETLISDFIARLLRCTPDAPEIALKRPTMAMVYGQWYDWKFGEHAAKKLSVSIRRSYEAAYKILEPFHDREMDSLSLNELQDFINNIGKSSSTVSNVLGVLKQMYRFAVPRDLCAKDIGQYLVMPSVRPQVHHDAFTEEQLSVLLEHSDDPRAAMVLIMCYSGFRVSAYHKLEINLEERYFKGGIKTKAGKDRIVPIHSGIYPLVVKHRAMIQRDSRKITKDMADILSELSLPPLTPHSCRHTFSALCERYGVNENDRKRLLGHAFQDVTNAVYGHRTIAELRTEIEKIRFVVICDH